jgi:hypothetical protein
VAPRGVYRQINDDLIPCQSPGSPVGGAYTWLDMAVERGVTYWYKLEEVDVQGRSRLYGPVWAQMGAGYRLYLPLIARQ